MTKGFLNDDFDVPGDITAGGIENTPIGDTTPSTGDFTTLSATGDLTAGGIENTPIGDSTPSTGDFTTLSVTGDITSTNQTAPAAGTIGEEIRATRGTAVALTSNVTANVTSITLTAGIWDISGRVYTATTGTVAGNCTFSTLLSLTTASATPISGVYDDVDFNRITGSGVQPISGIGDVGIMVGPYRLVLTGSDIIYLNTRARSTSTFTSVTADGTITAVRVA